MLLVCGLLPVHQVTSASGVCVLFNKRGGCKVQVQGHTFGSPAGFRSVALSFVLCGHEMPGQPALNLASRGRLPFHHVPLPPPLSND